MLGTENVSDRVRTEEMGMHASRVSSLPQVRNALIDLQRLFEADAERSAERERERPAGTVPDGDL